MIVDRPTYRSRQVMQIHAGQNEVEEGGLLPYNGDGTTSSHRLEHFALPFQFRKPVRRPMAKLPHHGPRSDSQV